jgi:hypothetical protein
MRHVIASSLVLLSVACGSQSPDGSSRQSTLGRTAEAETLGLAFGQACPANGTCTYGGTAVDFRTLSMSCSAGADMTVQATWYYTASAGEACTGIPGDCNGKPSCSFEADPATCGGDPNVGVPKNMAVTIACGPEPLAFGQACPANTTCIYGALDDENESQTMSCQSYATMTVNATWYYGQNAGGEACSEINSICNGQSSCTFVPSNGNCQADPAPGIVKSTAVEITCGSPPPPIPAGQFQTPGGIYYSNGSHYCSYSWGSFLRSGGDPNVDLPSYASIPPDMTYDGSCQVTVGSSGTSAQYFGYYSNGAPPDAANLSGTVNAMGGVGPSDFALIEQLAQAGIKSVLGVDQLFNTEGSCVAVSDFQQIWNNYVPTVAPYVNAGDIAAFYIADEPYGTLMSKFGCSYTQVYALLATLSGAMKASFPNVPIMTVDYADKATDPNVTYPSTIDFVGADFYPIYDGGSFSTVTSALNALETRLTPNQKLVLVPEAFLQGTSQPSPSQEQALVAEIGSFVSYARSNPRIGFVFAFCSGTWLQSNGQWFFGAQTMPLVRQALDTFGAEVVGNAWTATTTWSSALTSGTYSFHPAFNTGSCMDIYGGGSANGTQVDEYACNGTGAQNFSVEPAGYGLVNLVNPQSGKCLDIAAGASNNGAMVELNQCNGTSSQKFEVQQVGSRLATFYNPMTARCLDVSGANPANLTKVQLYQCNGTGAQQWAY